MDWQNLALSALFAAVFTTIGGLVVWYFQSRAESLRELERALRDRRLKLYTDTLDPFLRIFAGLGDARAQAEALRRVRSYEYRRTVFELTMFGSDEVVRAYNALMQHIYTTEKEAQDPRAMMHLWALLLLAIRRSGGNPETTLNEWEMLEGTISDIESLRD